MQHSHTMCVSLHRYLNDNQIAKLPELVFQSLSSLVQMWVNGYVGVQCCAFTLAQAPEGPLYKTDHSCSKLVSKRHSQSHTAYAGISTTIRLCCCLRACSRAWNHCSIFEYKHVISWVVCIYMVVLHDISTAMQEIIWLPRLCIWYACVLRNLKMHSYVYMYVACVCILFM